MSTTMKIKTRSGVSVERIPAGQRGCFRIADGPDLTVGGTGLWPTAALSQAPSYTLQPGLASALETTAAAHCRTCSRIRYQASASTSP